MAIRNRKSKILFNSWRNVEMFTLRQTSFHQASWSGSWKSLIWVPSRGYAELVMISFIVPAHNEQSCLGGTLMAINKAARSIGQPYEVIVVDDASTDSTADIARQHKAIVLPVNHRQIAATRNSGRRAAQGERLFFVDADTTINSRVITSALRHMDKGAVTGPRKLDRYQS
jgi:cellulose synthase/poly-beta-1,6-N-acetylglucosamine synthase-like glycosyltransferase